MADAGPSSQGQPRRDAQRVRPAAGERPRRAGFATGGIDLDRLVLPTERAPLDDAPAPSDEPAPAAPRPAGPPVGPSPGGVTDPDPTAIEEADEAPPDAPSDDAPDHVEEQAPEAEPDEDAPHVDAASDTVHEDEVTGPAAPPSSDHPVVATRSLHPMDPGMRLADRLESDRIITVPANRQGRILAMLGVLAGLAVTLAAQVVPGMRVMGLSLALVGAAAAVFSAVIWVLLVAYGRKRILKLHMAPDQQQQWEEVEAQARMTQTAQSLGIGAIGVGLAVAIAGYAIPESLRLGAVGMGGLLIVFGLALVGFAAARRGPLRLLYIQTLVLARLEQTGIGREVAADPKAADVLLALDALLGELPESSVRRFLSQPEAEWYLDMVARIREGGHG